MVNAERYKHRLRELLLDLYRKKAAQQESLERFKIEGFMEAGLLAQVVNNQEIERIIDKAHTEVFGVSYNSRNLSERDWLSIPAYIRENGARKS